jgi:myo-inositol-1(or 4)-monophosphatase
MLPCEEVGVELDAEVNMEPTLDQVVSWVKEAASMARQMRQEDLQVRHKSKADLVTEADTAIEAFLIDKIHTNFPNHSIKAEESGQHDGDQEDEWFIDPIDGTLNYAHGLPQYAISVAYACKGELKLGVIANPPIQEYFYAEAGKGSWLNGKPIHVSETQELIDSMLITGFRYHLLDTPRSNINNFIRLSHEVQSVRRLGSAALDLAYVACGRVEGFWEIDLSPWDVAAGILLIREAGGIVSTLHGEGHLLKGSVDILAANPVIFPKLQAILNEENAKPL